MPAPASSRFRSSVYAPVSCCRRGSTFSPRSAPCSRHSPCRCDAIAAAHRGTDSRPPLLLAAVLMGATSLAFEVLWTRILVFYLGSSVYAFSLMLVGFLLGVAIGSLAIGRFVDRLERPLALLAAVELGIAACAPLSIWLFATLDQRQIALSRSLAPAGLRGRRRRATPRRPADSPAADAAHGSELPTPGASLFGALRRRHPQRERRNRARSGRALRCEHPRLHCRLARRRLRSHSAPRNAKLSARSRRSLRGDRPAFRPARACHRARVARLRIFPERPPPAPVPSLAGGCGTGSAGALSRAGFSVARRPGDSRRRHLRQRPSGGSGLLPRGRERRGGDPQDDRAGGSLPVAGAERRQRRRDEPRPLRRAEDAGAPAAAARHERGRAGWSTSASAAAARRTRSRAIR